MPTLSELSRWLSTGQAAKRTGRSRQGILWMLQEGRLRGVKTEIGWLIDPESVKEATRDRGEVR